MRTAEHNEDGRSRRYVAWVDAGSAAPPIRCYVENVSRSGAKLSMFRASVPEEFTLHFNRTGDAKIRCRVVSCALPQCDVEFIASLEGYN